MADIAPRIDLDSIRDRRLHPTCNFTRDLDADFRCFRSRRRHSNVVHAIGGRRNNEHWWILLLIGLCGIGVGLLAFSNPAITTLVLLFYVAIWAIGTGLLEIVAAIHLRKEIHGEFWLALAGLLSIAFGMLLVARPAAGVLSVLWLIAGYATAFGVMLVVLAFRVRGVGSRFAAARA